MKNTFIKTIKGISFAFIFLFLFAFLVGCETVIEGNSEAKTFKESYEKLNGVEGKSGKKYREVTINENNPFVKITGDEIVSKIENKESFYLYVGDPKCPWCRSVVEVAIRKANEFEIEKIYYLNIWDDDFNEIFRDKYKLNDNNEVEVVTEGTDSYKKLLTYFDKLLNDYTLTDSEDNKIPVGEKRIFAPNYFYIDNGNPKLMVEGISDKQEDAYQELTLELISDEEKIFEDFFEKSLSCDDRC